MPALSDGGKTVTIKLRSGVKFNDGTPMNAEAVRFSLDRHRTMKGSNRRSELDSVTAVEVVDPLTVRLRLKAPFSPLAAQLADRAGMPVSPAAVQKLGEKFGTAPVCVGPWQFVERVAQDRIVVEKSTHYFDQGQAKFDRIVFRIIPDDNVRLANLRSGDIDFMHLVAPTDAASLKKEGRFEVSSVTGIGYNSLTINLEQDGQDEPARRPRHAARQRPSRARGARAVHRPRGSGPGGIRRPVHRRLRAHLAQQPVLRQVTQVPRARRRAGQEAARRRRARERLHLRDGHRQQPAAAACGRGDPGHGASEAGFTINLRPAEFASALNDNDDGKHQAFLVGWSGRVDPDGNIHQCQTCRGSLNATLACDERMDALLNKAREVDATSAAARGTLPRGDRPDRGRAATSSTSTTRTTSSAFPKNLKGYKAVPDGLIRIKGTTWQTSGAAGTARLCRDRVPGPAGAHLGASRSFSSASIVFAGVRDDPRGSGPRARRDRGRRRRARGDPREVRAERPDRRPVPQLGRARRCAAISASPSARASRWRATVAPKLPITIELALPVPARRARHRASPPGVIAAVRRNTVWDLLASGVSLCGVSVPNFWLGIMLILLVSVRLRLAARLRLRPAVEDPLGNLQRMLMPALVLGTGARRRADAPDAQQHDRGAERRLHPHRAQQGAGRPARSSCPPRPPQRAHPGGDDPRPADGRAHERRGRHRADLRGPRLRPADRGGGVHARLPGRAGRGADHRHPPTSSSTSSWTCRTRCSTRGSASAGPPMAPDAARLPVPASTPRACRGAERPAPSRAGASAGGDRRAMVGASWSLLFVGPGGGRAVDRARRPVADRLEQGAQGAERGRIRSAPTTSDATASRAWCGARASRCRRASSRSSSPSPSACRRASPPATTAAPLDQVIMRAHRRVARLSRSSSWPSAW